MSYSVAGEKDFISGIEKPEDKNRDTGEESADDQVIVSIGRSLAMQPRAPFLEISQSSFAYGQF
jgi:hypothetical protein